MVTWLPRELATTSSRRSIKARFWPYWPNSVEAKRLSSKVRTICAVLSGAMKTDSSVSGVRKSGSCRDQCGALRGGCRWCVGEYAEQAVAGDFGNCDCGDLADQRCRRACLDRLKIGRTADELPVVATGPFEQHVEGAAQAIAVERRLTAVDGILKTPQPFGFGRFVDLVRHFGARSAWPGRIFEGERPRKTDLGDQAQRIGKIILGFAGKPHDEVGSQRESRASLAQPPDHIQVIRPRVTAIHGGENAVRTGLHRQMQLRHEL